jgi:hypothetical protein
MAVGFLTEIAFGLLLFTVNIRYTSSQGGEKPCYSFWCPGARFLPDIGKIYRTALGNPYLQVESEIKDPDIARDYRALLDRTGLDKIGAE